MNIESRRSESITNWLNGQLVKPVDPCLWCGQNNWYKKKGVSWFCGSCDPEDTLLTWPERLELIRKLRAGRKDLEKLNDLPDNRSLSSVTWSAIERIAHPNLMEDPPCDDCTPVGLRGCEVEDHTNTDDYQHVAQGTIGAAQSRETDERVNKDQKPCPERITNFHGGKLERNKLLRIKNRLQSFTTEEKQETQSGS